jgi:hypothetical protein
MKDNFKTFLLLVHYWFPIALGWSVALVIQRATGLSISSSGIQLYLLGICAAYSLDRLLDEPGLRHPAWLTIALWAGFVISATLGFFLALQLSIQTLSALLVFSIITLFYRKAKKFPFLKTILVAVVWTWAGVALPFANPHWFAWQFWTMQSSVPLVMLIAAGCILCDFKDLKFDDNSGVRSLPLMFGLRKTVLITSAILLTAAAISFQEGRMGIVISSICLILLAQFPSVLSLEAIGPLLVDIALTIPGVLISLHMV